MAALTITAASVGIGEAGVSIEPVLVGESVTQGQPAYLKASDNKYWKADSNASSSTADAKGIFLTAASADGYALLQRGGKIVIGATVVVGTVYCVGATAGSIVPIADLTTGDYVTIIGTASTSGIIDLNFKSTGIVKP